MTVSDRSVERVLTPARCPSESPRPRRGGLRVHASPVKPTRWPLEVDRQGQKKEWVEEEVVAGLDLTFRRPMLTLNLDPVPGSLIFVRKRENSQSCFNANDEG